MANQYESKADRLGAIQLLLLDHPHGLTMKEVAAKMGVATSTIWRYYRSGSLERKGITFENGWLKADRASLRINVGLSLQEAMALHLATRLLATRMDRRNPHAASALRKVSRALETSAEPVSRMMQRSADELDSEDQWADAVYIQTLETLTEALATGHKVHAWYPSERSGRMHDYILSPYLIEPYAIGQTTHVIGPIDPHGRLFTFKIERIHKVELLPDRYVIPAEFDPQELLKDAWGIWFTGSDPVDVVLHFTPEVAKRVKESRWHRSQRIEEQPDGSLIWRASIAEPREMVPWVRSWGENVRVLQPENLLEEKAD